MKYLDVSFARHANTEIIRLFGGSSGVVNDANLFHVLNRVKTVGKNLRGRNRIIAKTAYLFYELIYRVHAFTDGNKRTGLALANTFLDINGYTLTSSPEELTGLALSVASGQLGERQIREWLLNVIEERRK